MALGLSLLDVPSDGGIDPAAGLVSRTAYGYEVSVTHATFPAGYRSVPHAHESEELEQLIEGELSVLIDGAEYQLRTGDFFRIPALAVHWKRNRSAAPAVVLELHNRPRRSANAASLLDTFEREDASFGAGKAVRFGQTYRASRYYADGEEDFPKTPSGSPLLARGDDVWAGASAQPLPNIHGSAGTNKSVRVGGETMAILLSERVGLKARPHLHAAEQISYVVEGEVWTFIDDRVVFSKAGDVIRVPGNVVHWALVEPGKKAVTFEVHTPLQGDPVTAHGMNWLVPPHRVPNLSWIPGGFPTDALPAEDLEPFEAGLVQATTESLELEKHVAGYGIKPTGARR
jgi:quercetin dioxygenase-like cupin family protein